VQVQYSESERFDRLLIAWSDDSSTMVVLDFENASSGMMTVFRSPEFVETLSSRVELPDSWFEWPNVSGIRFSAQANRLAVDFTNADDPPHGAHYALCIYENDPRVRPRTFEWNRFNGAAPLLNSDMTTLCLGVNEFHVDSIDNDLDSWLLVIVDVDSQSETHVLLEQSDASFNRRIGDFDHPHTWLCHFTSDEEHVVAQPREKGPAYLVSLAEARIVHTLEPGNVPAASNSSWSLPQATSPNYSGSLRLDALRSAALTSPGDVADQVGNQAASRADTQPTGGGIRRIPLELPDE